MSDNLIHELGISEESKQPESTTDTPMPGHQAMTKEEILAKMKDFLNAEELPSRNDIDHLKQQFYKIKTSELDAAKADFIEKGGNPDEFVSEVDPLEEEFKSELNSIKEKRAQVAAEDEKSKEENLAKKLRIIDKIKDLTESTDDFGKLYKEFKDLQQEWNDIKQVPQGKIKELWRSYQIYTEKFYDLLKINNELRDYDFKKNLELKNSICEAVEKLQEEPDIISAFHQLQNFHQQWRDIGPVAKELRDEIWDRFKKASTAINKKYQEHFVKLKASEEDNLKEKTAICDELRVIDYSQLKTPKDWDEKTKEVIALQEKWKTIGFVPRKVNSQIFEEFRSLSDVFFDSKGEFFRGQRGAMEVNLEKKRALCERAKELSNSTDWKKTADELIVIQKEWKTIGPVPRKYSDNLWKEFIAACDSFFDQRNKQFVSQKEEEQNNLILKKELIEKIKNIVPGEETQLTMDQIHEYMDEWNKIGFVPFKEKDKIYKEYQAALDVHFDNLKVNRSERRLQNFRTTVEDISKSDRSKGKLLKERDRLIHQYNKIKTELQTYENNIGFLSISKGSDGLLKDMNNRIEGLKNELELIEKKIDTINESVDIEAQ